MTEVAVEVMRTYSPELANDLGHLATQLSTNRTADPIPRHKLERIIGSDDRAQFIATDGDRTIGAATLSTLVGWSKEDEGWLEDFVVDEAYRARGVGSQLWQEMVLWCQERGISRLGLECETHRVAARNFYERRGARLVSGSNSHYRVDIPSSGESRDSGMRIPAEISRSYGIERAGIAPLTDGLVNETVQIYQLKGSKLERGILQRLAPMYDERVQKDAVAAATHLRAVGWETPESRPTKSGALITQDADGRLWRLLERISSDERIPELYDTQLATTCGHLLGRWHRDISNLDYRPQYHIPHFHESAYHSHRLHSLRHDMEQESEARQWADTVLLTSEQLPDLPAAEPQLIHGDPKLSNMLFRSGKPFTLIDFDTIMHANPWLDVGDHLRSALGRVAPEDTEAIVRSFAAGYGETDEIIPSVYHNALIATEHLAIELATRYLNDIVDDNYFAWDHTRYDSRAQNHLARVRQQMDIAARVRLLREMEK